MNASTRNAPPAAVIGCPIPCHPSHRSTPRRSDADPMPSHGGQATPAASTPPRTGGATPRADWGYPLNRATPKSPRAPMDPLKTARMPHSPKDALEGPPEDPTHAVVPAGVVRGAAGGRGCRWRRLRVSASLRLPTSRGRSSRGLPCCAHSTPLRSVECARPWVDGVGWLGPGGGGPCNP